MDLIIAPCRQLCDWQLSPIPADPATHPDRLLACTGCGSQWTADERWTPRQADGSEPPAARAELDRAGRRRTGPSRRAELSRRRG